MENENIFESDDFEDPLDKVRELEQQLKEAKAGSKDKTALKKRYNDFISAKKIYDSIRLNFHRGQTPRYFYSLHTDKTDKRGNHINVQDIVYFTHGTLYPSFVELKSEDSRTYLRKMIEGQTIKIQKPTGEIEVHTFERRVYDKLTNTNHLVDDKTYNLVNLEHRLIPQNVETAECPTIFKALLYAITGNVITYNEQEKRWDCDKPDTLEWFEKWIYGAVCANIGDNSMSMPVIFGTGKVGKNALFDIVFRQILGSHACFSGTWDVIDSNFNSFKLGKVFMFIDEVPPREDWSKIKNMTGSPVTYVKEKYGPEFEVDNCIVNAFGSNSSTYPLPWEDGEQMMRVSPIKTSPRSTFAENTVKMLNKEFEGQFEEPFCDAVIRASDNNPDEMTEFKKGEFILRTLMATEWQSSEAAQQFLNYLHNRYKSNYYQISPLRSTDWYDIKSSKVNGHEVTIDYIKAVMPDIITISELYEIYTTAIGDSYKQKNKTNFSADIKSDMVSVGYEFKRTASLKDGLRDDAFVKLSAPRGTITNYTPVYDRYIRTEMVNGRQIKHLIWPTAKEEAIDQHDDLFDTRRLTNILERAKR